jgi:pyroglutamyl-peptidase
VTRPSAIARSDRPVVLLTGFGPFPGVPANATSVLVPQIAEAARKVLPGVTVADLILPTEWEASLALLDEHTGRLRPVVALHFGVASRASGFEIEVRGRNLCTLAEDAAGRLPFDRCLSRDGPEFLAATLPSAHIVQRLRRLGIPSRISRDAGGYLCNAVLYRSLENSRAYGAPVRTGFVHLPSTLVDARRPSREPASMSRLSWRDVVDGGVEVLAAALGRSRTVALARRAGLRGPHASR